MKLLSPASANTKTRKSAEKAQEYRIVALALSPATSDGQGKSNCPNSSIGCEDICVGSENVGLASIFKSIAISRQNKSLWLKRDPIGFYRQLSEELETEQRLADRDGTTLVIRPNTFTDLNWFKIFRDFPRAIGYDYSKVYNRVNDPTRPENYTIVPSWTERPKDQRDCLNLLAQGFNCAVCFAEIGPFAGNRALSQKMPKTWSLNGMNVKVLDGDDSDLRFLDERAKPGQPGFAVGLRLKSANNVARQKAIDSGFCQIVK